MSWRQDEGRNRVLDADDAALWAHVAAQVRPLAKARIAAKPLKAPPVAAQPEVRPTSAKTPPAKAPPLPAPLAPTSRERLHRTDERKLRRGSVAIGGRLDLHGLSRAEAHRAVDRFIARLADDGERIALVITGKGRGREIGSGEGDGVLRSEFPRWIAEGMLARLVLAWRPAAPRHGGDGAFYVLLRRKGKPS